MRSDGKRDGINVNTSFSPMPVFAVDKGALFTSM